MFTPQRMPPIQYLAAFAAAAHHNSFKLAAVQLNVSPSAISQQIKSLEVHIGLSLFSREKRSITLTPAGESFYQVAQRTLNQYEKDYRQFTGQYFSSSLKISMIPYIANEVVIPKLHEFHDQYPALNLIVQTSMQLEKLELQELDAAIRFGVPPWGKNDVQLISSAYTSLMASQSYLDKHLIKQPIDWSQQTLIHSRSHVNDWQRFMNESQLTFKPKKELFFDSYDAGIRAAEEGLGITIGAFPISSIKIKEGKLVALAKNPIAMEEAFYFVTSPNLNKQKDYQIVLKWLKALFVSLSLAKK